MREVATICPRPLQVDLDLLTLKVVSESRVTWDTSVPILVFLCLSVLDLGPMYATNRQTSDAHHRLMPPGAGHNNRCITPLQLWDLEQTPLLVTTKAFSLLTNGGNYVLGSYVRSPDNVMLHHILPREVWVDVKCSHIPITCTKRKNQLVTRVTEMYQLMRWRNVR